MIKIIVCDDQEKEYVHLNELLTDYAESRQIDLAIRYFRNGQDLLEAEIQQTDLFFLDVEMPGINGIETGKEIRKRNNHCEIVFITNYIQYALQGYEVQAFRYLLSISVKVSHSVQYREPVRPLVRAT